ncbi:MAG: hypothetical protein AB9903_28780 [Vulcanimicrobiota bacterium]
MEGRAEGKAEGRTEGRLEEKYEMIKRLRALGEDVSRIALITGLSEEEIGSLIERQSGEV